MNKHELEQAGYSVIEAKKGMSWKNIIITLSFAISVLTTAITLAYSYGYNSSTNQATTKRLERIEVWKDEVEKEKLNEAKELNKTLSEIKENIVDIKARLGQSENKTFHKNR